MKSALLFLFLVGAAVHAQQIGGEYKSTLLYTVPDPSAKGGLHLISTVQMQFAFAIPQGNQEHVYKAEIDGNNITFANLPVARATTSCS